MQSERNDRGKPQRRGAGRPMFTIFLLVIVIFLVFAFIVFRQVRSAEERRLRLLAGFANRVEVTVEELASRFARIASQRCAGEVDSYLELIPNVEDVTSVPADLPCPSQEDEGGGVGSGDRAGEPPGTLSLVSRGAHLDLVYERRPGAASDPRGPPPEDGPRAVEHAIAWIDLREVIGTTIIPGIFDSVLIADEQGDVLLQQGSPELEARRLDSLLGEIRGSEPELPEAVRVELERLRSKLALGQADDGSGAVSESPGDTTTVIEGRIADTEYKVFLQPVTIRPQVVTGRPMEEPFRWVAVGLISSENLLSAGVTTSPVLLFILVSLFPLALISWPFLKITLISRRQPFNRLDFASLIFATLLALSFFALLLVDALFLTNVRSALDRQLEDLATSVDQTFRSEVLDAYHQLDRLDADPEFGKLEGLDFLAYAEAIGDGGNVSPPVAEVALDEPESGSEAGATAPPGSAVANASSFISDRVKNYLEEEVGPLSYPYFDAVLWPDSSGNVTGANLPLVEHAVLPQNVEDRAYFRCARAWRDPVTLGLDRPELERYRERGGAYSADAAAELPIRLCVQSILDRASGRSALAISRRRAPQAPASGSDGTDAQDRPVVALITRLPSLAHPVLPPESGFAIVESTGRVLFHSDPRRAHTEDFVNASDENQLLQALLQTRREGALSIHYWGRRHRAYVLPIEDLPWSVVVFRSLEDVRLRNFELIYDFLNPFVLVLFFFLIGTTLFKFLTPRHFRIYLWPTPRHLPAYRSIVVWTLLLLVLFVVLFWLRDHISYVWIFYTSLLVVPATVAFVVAFLPWYHRSRGPNGSIYDLLTRWIGVKRDRRAAEDRAVSSGEQAAAEPRPGAEPSPPAHEPGEEGDEGSAVSQIGRRVRGRRFWVLIAVASITAVGMGFALHQGADILLVWLGTAIVALLFARWWLREELRDGERRRKAYIFALGCLLLLSFLPCIGFLHLASTRQVQYMTQDTQRALAEAIEQRDDDIDELEGPLDLYDPYRSILDRDRDRYLESLFDSKLGATSEEEAGAGRLWPYGVGTEGSNLFRWMHRLFAGRPLPLNDLTPAPAGIDLSRFRADVGPWTRLPGSERSDRIELTTARDLGSGERETLVSTLPGTGSHEALGPLVALTLGVGLVGLLASPFFFSWFIAEKLLLISLVYLGKRDPGSGSSARSPRLRPNQSIPKALIEARDQAGSDVVKRLVLVTGQLDRSAWRELVKKVGDENASDFEEVSFRKKWSRVVAGATGETAEAAAGPASEATEAGGRTASDRALRFAQELAATPPKDDEDTKRPILLLIDFQPDTSDPSVASDQSHAIREVVEGRRRSVIILSDVLPSRPAADAPPASEAEARARRHWIDLLGSFPVRHARDLTDYTTFDELFRKRRDKLRELLERSLKRDIPLLPRQVEHWERIIVRIRRECEHTSTLRAIGRRLVHELAADLDETSGDAYLDLVTEDHIIARIEAEARLHYRYLWNQCTIDERLALYQLAKHGLVNPKYFAWVLDLVQRGLVVRGPDLRLMNESFRRFILYEVDRSQVLQWEEEMGTSAWGLLKWILPFPLLFLAGFLFITQRDAVSNAAGVLIALASLAPVVFNLYGKFQEVNLRRTESRASVDES